MVAFRKPFGDSTPVCCQENEASKMANKTQTLTAPIRAKHLRHQHWVSFDAKQNCLNEELYIIRSSDRYPIQHLQD